MNDWNNDPRLGALLQPRRVLTAALVLSVAGALAVFAGAGRLGPMGLLLGELLAIYGLILWSTPAVPPLSSRLPERAAAPISPAELPSYVAAGRRRGPDAPPTDETAR
jgi:hypothetical protein